MRGLWQGSVPAKLYHGRVNLPRLLVYLWLVPPRGLDLPLGFILLIFLLLVATIDIEHRLILHLTSIAGAVLGLGVGIHLHGVISTLIGGAVAYGVMLLFYYFGELFVRYMSKRRNEATDEVALGFGDVNLAGITGLCWVGRRLSWVYCLQFWPGGSSVY